MGARADHAGNDGWSEISSTVQSPHASLQARRQTILAQRLRLWRNSMEVARRTLKSPEAPSFAYVAHFPLLKVVRRQAPRIVQSNVRRSKDITRYSACDMRAILGNAATVEPRDGSADSNSKRRRVESKSEVIAAGRDKKKGVKKAKVGDKADSHSTQEQRPKKKKNSAARTKKGRDGLSQKSNIT